MYLVRKASQRIHMETKTLGNGKNYLTIISKLVEGEEQVKTNYGGLVGVIHGSPECKKIMVRGEGLQGDQGVVEPAVGCGRSWEEATCRAKPEKFGQGCQMGGGRDGWKPASGHSGWRGPVESKAA